jgi:hypothetical protein
MDINDHRGPLDQIKQLARLAICAHNRRLRGYLEGLSRLFGIAGYRQIAVASVKVGDIAGEGSRKNPEDESEKTSEREKRETEIGTCFHRLERIVLELLRTVPSDKIKEISDERLLGGAALATTERVLARV